METIKRCNRCITPVSLRGVILDDKGLCNHCRMYEKMYNNWEKEKSQKEKEL